MSTDTFPKIVKNTIAFSTVSAFDVIRAGTPEGTAVRGDDALNPNYPGVASQRMDINHYFVPEGHHEDFPTINMSGYDYEGQERPTTAATEVEIMQRDMQRLWKDHLDMDDKTPLLRRGRMVEIDQSPFEDSDALFAKLHDFEKNLNDKVFKVDAFYGEVFDKAWIDYVDARHKAIFYRAKVGAVPSRFFNPPPACALIFCPETRKEQYRRLVPNFDKCLVFADTDWRVVREMFYEGHGCFYDDKHKAYFIGMFKYLYRLATLCGIHPRPEAPFDGEATYRVYGAIPPMELATEHSAPAHAYLTMSPLSRLELYQPNLCDMCEVPCQHLVSETNCYEYCRFIAMEHAKDLNRTSRPEGYYLPRLQRPHRYCEACFEEFCRIKDVARCALCNHNEVFNDTPREFTDWQYGVNRGWVKNRYTTITGKPTPKKRVRFDLPPLSSSESSSSESTTESSEPALKKKFRKCFCCDMSPGWNFCTHG